MADKNPIYDYLKSEGMTDLSEQDFVNKYSDREQLQPVYDWLKENGNTDLEFEPFADKYFPSPKSNEVSSQGSEVTSGISGEPSQISQSTNIDQATLAEQSTGGGYVLPEGAVDLTNPEQGIYAYYDPNIVNVDTGEMGDVVNRLEAVEIAPTREQLGVPEEESITVLESIKNSFKNVGTQLRGFDDRAVLTSTGVFSWLFGEDLARKVYNFLEVTSDRTFDTARAEAVAELEVLSEEMLPTLGIVDSWQERSLPGVVAGVVNGASSMLSTLVTAIPTLGGGIGIDVIGGSFENYNNAKAESLGITTQELYDTKQADFGTPLLIGSVGTALEAVGLRGVTNSITSKLTSSVAKRLSVLGLDMNKEGMTEWIQHGLEQYGNAKAIGASESEAINALANALVSAEGLESYLQGVSGAGVTIAGGRLGRNIIDRNSRDRVDSDVKKIQSITEDLGKVTDPAVKNQMLESAGELATEVNRITNENNALLESLTPEQQQQAEQLTVNIESITETLITDETSDSPMSQETRQVLEARRDQLGQELDAIVSETQQQEATTTENESTQVDSETTVENAQVDALGEQTTEAQGLVAETQVADDSGVQQNEAFTETEQSELVNTVSQIQGVEDVPTFVTSIRNSLSDSNIRQNRISELEQRFQQRRERGDSAGIAQDPRQEAQYWADVTEYAILKVADGTIKTAQALAETLGIDVNNPNVQKAFTDAEAVNNIITESTVTPQRTTTAQNIRRSTQGGIQGRESLTTRQALGNQMRTLNRGARDMAKNTRDLAGTISAYIQSQRSRLRGARVSQTVVNRVANAVSGVTNEAQLNRALNVVEKYIADAEFRTKLNNIAGQQRSLKRASSQMPADRRRVVRDFADINPIDLSASKLDNYLTIMQDAQRVAFADVGDVSNEQLQAYVDEAKLWGDKRVAERALNTELREASPEYQEQRLEAKKSQLKELGLTDAEINDLVDPTKDFKEVLADLESERKELTPTRIEVLRNNAERLANTVKSNRAEIRSTLQTASDRRLFDRLVNNLNIDNLSDRKVLTANYVLHNVAVEGSMVGTLDLIASLDSANKLQKNTNFLATAFRDVGQAMWTYLNMPIFGAQGRIKIEALVKDSDIAGRLNTVTGFLDYTRSASRAINKVKDITKRSEKIATKHKGKWSDVNDKIKMSMYIITSQYRDSWTPEQIQENYVGRWKAIAESYDRLVNDPSSYNRKVNAPLAERLKGFIQEDSSPDTNPNALVRVIRDSETGRITESIPLVTSEELFNQLPNGYKEYYNFTRETFDANKEDFFSIREASDNKVLEKDWVNYYPLSYTTYNNKAGSATASNASNTVDLREAPGRGRRSITGEASGAGNDRTLLGDRLPVGQIFNFQMLDTFLEDAGQMIYDSETTLDRWIVNETTDFRKNGLGDALQGTDSHIGAMEHYRVVVADKLQNDEFNLRLPTLNADVPLSHRLGMQLVQSIRNVGASVSLGSLMGAQRLKQTTPLVETFARLKNKKSFGTAMKLIIDKDPRVKTLVEESTLALRDITDTHLGLRSESRGVSEREYGLLASGTIKGVEGFSKLTEKLSGISLKELQNSDLDYATIGWLSMYIDKATEGGQPLDLDSVNDVAFAYAENQNEIIMNSSDRAMQGNYSKSTFLKSIAPMMSFSMNTVNSLILSVDRMMYYAKRGDMSKARYYAKEVTANYANAGLFQAISTAIRVGGLTAQAYIGEVAYDAILAWMEDDEEDEFKKERIMKLKEGSEEYQIQANNAIQRSLLNSGGYLINDLLSRGILFGDAGSELGGFLAGVAYEKTLGKDYLDSVDWKPMAGFSRGGVAGAVDQVAGLTGIFGMGLGALVNVGTDLGAVLETQEDFIKARRGFATAEGDDIVLNDFDLTEEGLLEYGKPFLAEQSEFLSLTLSAVAMLGLSDQVFNSFSRGIRASTKRTLNEVYGKGKSETQLKKIMREVSNFSEITELGATYTPTPEELGKLKAEYLNNVAYYRGQLGAIPLKSEREDAIIKTARFKTIKEFYEKNPHVRETITKEIYNEARKSTREGELLIKSMKSDRGE